MDFDEHTLRQRRYMLDAVRPITIKERHDILNYVWLLEGMIARYQRAAKQTATLKEPDAT